MANPIASMQLFAIDPRGGRVHVASEIYPPRQIDNGDAACRVLIRGLPRQLDREVFGVDTLQALSHATHIIYATMISYQDRGWRFMYEGDEREPSDNEDQYCIDFRVFLRLIDDCPKPPASE